MIVKKSGKAQIQLSLLVVLLLFLAACGGSTDEAVEDTSETDTGAIDDTTDSEAIEDEDIDATGSEEDSGELPPPPNTGSKTEAPRATPNIIANDDTAVASQQTPPANRIDSDQTTAERQLDLVLLLDATGSMADELSILQIGLDEIAAELASLPNDISIRYGFVIYRDQAKSDSVELFGLTNEWTLFAENLMAVTAVGGGDYPENLNGGLFQAVNNMNWNPQAEHLLLLLGDAPPHPNTAETVPIEETLLAAAEQNITIFTVGSDGLNEPGIAIYQQIAEMGNGHFIFISHSPANNQLDTAVVQPIENLTNVLVEIMLEALNEEAP